MSLLTKRTVIGIEQETTEGSAATIAATDFILAEDIQFKDVIERGERPAQRATLDTMPSVSTKRYIEVSFRTEVKASGAAGTAYAPLGVALQACGMTETIVGATSVTYAPTSAPASANYQGPGKTATIAIYADGVCKATIVGCRGNCTIMLTPAGVCYYNFTFQGVWVALTDVALPTTTFLAGNPAATTSTFLIQAYAATAHSLEIDFGNTLAMRPSLSAATGYASCIITGRKPTGKAVVEATLVATHDYWGKVISNAEASTSLIVTTGSAGGITTITMPKTQYTNVTPGDADGVRTWEVDMQFNRNADDDFISIAQT